MNIRLRKLLSVFELATQEEERVYDRNMSIETIKLI